MTILHLMIKVSLTLVFSLIFITLYAQHPTTKRDYVHNNMIWFSTQVNGKIKGKFNYGLDIEYRRQADPQYGYEKTDVVGSAHLNIFKSPLQTVLRPWLHFQANDKFRFSWSPITWYAASTFPSNGKTYYTPEYRTSPQVTIISSYGRIQLTHRYRYEIRFIGVKTLAEHPNDPTGPPGSYTFLHSGIQNRFRYQLRASIALNKSKIEKGTYYITTAGEILINTGKNVSNYKLLDQTRINLIFGYKFHKDMRFEVGYMNQMAFRFNNIAKNNVDFNNIVMCSFIFDNLNALLKKKAKQE